MSIPQRLIQPFLKGCLFFLLSFTAYSPGLRAQELVPSDSVAQTLTASEKEMFRIITEGDKPAAEKIFAHDYITINADGVMQDKEEVMKTFGKFKGSTYGLSERKIRVSGNMGVINGRAKFYLKSALVAEVFYTELWILRSGGWEFLGWQGTMTGLPSNYPVIMTVVFLLLLFLIIHLIRRRRRRSRVRIAVAP